MSTCVLPCLLVGNTLQRFLIVEAKVSCMDYVVRACLLCKFIERFEVAWNAVSMLRAIRVRLKRSMRHTADICYTEDTSSAILNDASVVLQMSRIRLGLIVGAVGELSLVVIGTWLEVRQHIPRGLKRSCSQTARAFGRGKGVHLLKPWKPY